MARFLTTTGVSHELEELIRGAEKWIVLISPYLRVNQRIRNLLADKDRLKIDTRVVYGKKELSADESAWLLSTSIRTSYCANLHAKCYLSEKKALLTSMNLYEFSQVNNIEMGVLISRDQDGPLYDDVHREADLILQNSEEHRPGTSLSTTRARQRSTTREADRASGDAAVRDKPRPARKRSESQRVTDGTPSHAFCIRCRGSLPADPSKPYCTACYKSWSRYKNEAHQEKHCHLCGNDHAATLERPVCRQCFRKHKTSFNFTSN